MFEQLWTTKEIGKRLKSERLRLGLSQENLAVAGGIRRTTLYQYERGDRRPSLDFLTKATSAGLDLNYMIFGERNIKLADEVRIERHVLEKINGLVNRFARDSKGRALAVEHQQELFRQLCGIVEQRPEHEIDWNEVESVAVAFAA